MTKKCTCVGFCALWKEIFALPQNLPAEEKENKEAVAARGNLRPSPMRNRPIKISHHEEMKNSAKRFRREKTNLANKSKTSKNKFHHMVLRRKKRFQEGEILPNGSEMNNSKQSKLTEETKSLNDRKSA